MTGVNEMGRVLVDVEVESVDDLYRAARGEILSDQIRRVRLHNALVDTGATTLCLPASNIQQSGLLQFGEKTSMSSAGPRTVRLFGPVKLTVQVRDCHVDVLELPDGVPAQIGQIPLEFMDFVIDLRSQKLIGNPAHGGEQMLECY